MVRVLKNKESINKSQINDDMAADKQDKQDVFHRPGSKNVIEKMSSVYKVRFKKKKWKLESSKQKKIGVLH